MIQEHVCMTVWECLYDNEHVCMTVWECLYDNEHDMSMCV